MRCLDACWPHMKFGSGPLLEVGTSVGRSTFEMAARTDGLVLGIDLNIAMLRIATRVLREGRVKYPRRRIGVVYDQRDFEVSFEAADRVDFFRSGIQKSLFLDGFRQCPHMSLFILSQKFM